MKKKIKNSLPHVCFYAVRSTKLCNAHNLIRLLLAQSRVEMRILCFIESVFCVLRRNTDRWKQLLVCRSDVKQCGEKNCSTKMKETFVAWIFCRCSCGTMLWVLLKFLWLLRIGSKPKLNLDGIPLLFTDRSIHSILKCHNKRKWALIAGEYLRFCSLHVHVHLNFCD